MPRAVRWFLTGQSTVAAAVLVVVALACSRTPLEAHWVVPPLMAAATTLALRVPVPLPSPHEKRVKIADGAAFAAALVLLPPPWAALSLSAGAVVRELADRRPAKRRLHSAAANVIAYSSGALVTAALAGTDPPPIRLLPAIVLAAFVHIAVYQLLLRGIVSAHGRAEREALDAPLLGHDPWGDLAVIVAGAGLGQAGTYGPVPLVITAGFAGVSSLLYARYQRLRVGQARLNLLIETTSRINEVVTVEAIEAEVLDGARRVLGWPAAELSEAPPADPTPSAAIHSPGQPSRWLHPGAAATALSQDYLTLDRQLVGVLADVATAAIQRLADRARLEHAATHDELTGLLNRKAFEDRLRRRVAQARRDGRGFTVLYGDLDGFKPVNDRLGHHAGDEALRVLGQRLAAAVRDQDAVARIGGDEFVVLLDLAAPDAVAAAIARIEQRIRAPMHLGSEVVAIDISLGAAAWPDDGGDARTLLDAADAAMFARKRLGRADEDADEETRPTGGRAHRP